MNLFHRTIAGSLAASVLCLSVAVAAPSTPPQAGQAKAADVYSMGDFARVRKYDAHVHANTRDNAFLEQARADGFELLSINVDYPAFPSVAVQHEAAVTLAKQDPARFHWATT